MFGVALDASDDPMSLELKWASMLSAGGAGNGIHADPYDAMAGSLEARDDFQLAGKFPVPSWLGPRPLPADHSLLTLENFRRFYERRGFLDASEGIRDFVKQHIFPDSPVMIGIDHSATGGVVSALSERYGSRNLAVIVLDRHFDGIGLSCRLAADAALQRDGRAVPPEMMPFSTLEAEEYCCGSFWAYLMNAGLVLPQNLLFIGVADYPERNDAGDGWQGFREAYLDYEEKGCRYFPLRRFAEPYLDELSRFIDQHVTTPYLYVSLDVDVGSLNCVHAARYMDGPGISRQNLLDVARAIAKKVQGGAVSLAGFDIMEFNMHFLGIRTEDGLRDRTLEVVREFIGLLLPGMPVRSGELACSGQYESTV